jgi:hypothetical protein
MRTLRAKGEAGEKVSFMGQFPAIGLEQMVSRPSWPGLTRPSMRFRVARL